MVAKNNTWNKLQYCIITLKVLENLCRKECGSGKVRYELESKFLTINILLFMKVWSSENSQKID